MSLLLQKKFSDLIFGGKDSSFWFFKGVPGKGAALVPIPEELFETLCELYKHLHDVYASISDSISTRVVFSGIAFRAAAYTDVDQGRTFFLRRLPDAIPSMNFLRLPEPVTEWLLRKENSKGLFLISGPQASGKTTTAGALIAARLAKFGGHAVTYEHPVEMPLSGRHGEHAFCFQSEIASEDELPERIERSHRYASPNIIFVGEIRTKYAASEVLRVALGSSQQLVIATIHGIDACSSLDRLLAWARELDGDIAYHNLAQTLLGILYQELDFGTEEGKPLLTAKEFLLLGFNDEANQIRAKLRAGNTHLLDHIREQRNRIAFDSEAKL